MEFQLQADKEITYQISLHQQASEEGFQRKVALSYQDTETEN